MGARPTPLCPVAVAVGAHDLALGGLQQDTHFSASQTSAEVEQLDSANVVELHHVSRVALAAIRTQNVLECVEKSSARAVHDIHLSLRLSEVVGAVGVIVP